MQEKAQQFCVQCLQYSNICVQCLQYSNISADKCTLSLNTWWNSVYVDLFFLQIFVNKIELPFPSLIAHHTVCFRMSHFMQERCKCLKIL